MAFGEQTELPLPVDIDFLLQCLSRMLVDGLIADIEHGVNVAPVFLACGELIGMVVVPEPQGAPVVHDHLQAEVSVVVAVARVVEPFLLDIVIDLVILHGGLAEDAPEIGLVVGQCLQALLEVEILLEENVYLVGELLQLRKLLALQGCRPVLQNLVHVLHLVGVCLLLLRNLQHAQHILVGQ